MREIATLSWRLGPRIITREDYQQTLDVLGFTQGRPLSKVIADTRSRVADLSLPTGYSLNITGEQTDIEAARTSMLRALAFGILAVYLVLVAQFRSFGHPLTIMLAIPLQFIGVGFALLIIGKYLSMPSAFHPSQPLLSVVFLLRPCSPW